MLLLLRKKNEMIVIDEWIWIMVVVIKGKWVVFGIEVFLEVFICCGEFLLECFIVLMI